MSITQGHEEVQARLFTFAEIAFDQKKRKWSAFINPYMLQGFAQEPLPPGQIIHLNPSTVELEVENEGLLDAFAKGERAHFEGEDMWAARPYFHSWEAAQRKIMWWLNEKRSDLVDACIDETRQAIAYRARTKADEA